MKLYVKQKVFSWTDKFTVKDEYGEDKYYVTGKFLTFGKKLTVTDRLGMEVAYIHQKVLSLLPRFFVDVNGRTVAEIVKKFTLLKPEYLVKGPGWTVEGAILAHDYEIYDAGRNRIVSIHKKWMSWGDSFELDIAPGADVAAALGVVLAIDAVMDANASAAAAASN